MTIQEILTATGLPVRYSHFTTPQEPPFIVYLGDGQTHAAADNGYILKRNNYQVEYYFTKKDEEAEDAIETALEQGGFLFDKSADAYISEENVFVIYYTAYSYFEATPDPGSE